MEWLLIDGIGPFFHGYTRKRINWSKIPFAHLETPTGLKPALRTPIRAEFARFVTAAAAAGFNAVTLDDLAHLYVWPGYAGLLKAKLRQYQAFYRDLFALAAQAGLRVFMTTDVMFYTPELKQLLGHNTTALVHWWQEALRSIFTDFPELAGIIMRFGEADSSDVKHTFRSELVLRTPRQVRRFLARLLPVFEHCGKLLIFRTWSVGAHRVGDLMWHRGTYRQVFGSLRSPQLIISMKYGESDFFRFLPLNAHFYRGAHKKLIEFQTRREYEGFGEYPTFVGWQYECYRHSGLLLEI
jgi:alpha-glucuronidase